ncbi:MAG: 16S rRNA (guanine(527)-N(7))-methyltransferase RsmG [Bacteroidales bacterium]|nr:16S rRNA (guanine(527)-N(7))-methyltransferase RsmG [Bacteroidales bacterium]
MTGPEFISFLKEFFPLLSPSQEEKFLMMDSLYRDWNSKINVISRKDIDNLYSHHILHSLAIARYLQLRPEMEEKFRNSSVLDLGCGGGFPGIPLAVMFPDAHFTLCDSVGKKTIVASGVSESLGLENVVIVNARAESLGRQFDFVVSRAVASLQDFYPWIKGRYKQHVLYLKGGDVNEEIAEMMGRFRMKKGSVSTWPVDSWLSEEYFKGKLIVDII